MQYAILGFLGVGWLKRYKKGIANWTATTKEIMQRESGNLGTREIKICRECHCVQKLPEYLALLRREKYSAHIKQFT